MRINELTEQEIKLILGLLNDEIHCTESMINFLTKEKMYDEISKKHWNTKLEKLITIKFKLERREKNTENG